MLYIYEIIEHISVPKGIDIGQTLIECILNTFVYRLGQVCQTGW